jgi:hypothetical protein
MKGDLAADHACGKPRPGLLDMPGVMPAQVAGFYAAASFFRQAPWKEFGYEAAIWVECDRFQSGPWYAVLMVQLGLTTELALRRKRSWSGPSPRRKRPAGPGGAWRRCTCGATGSASTPSAAG